MRKPLTILATILAASSCGRSQNETSALQANAGGIAANDIIQIHSSARMAGAIDSLKFGGTEFINAFDHGRELQTAYILDNGGECYNPTEAGSGPDATGPVSSSQLLAYAAAGSVLTSSSHPAFWLRPGQPHPLNSCPGAINTTVTSPDLIEKRVDVGFGGIRHIVRYHARVTLAQGHQALQIEAATGYQMANFTKLYAWNQESASLSPVDGAYTEQSQPAIAATADGSRAIGAWAPQLAGYSLSYGRGYFPGDAASGTSKWTVVYRRGATPAGSYDFDVYIAVGSLENVRVALAQMRGQVVGGAVMPVPVPVPVPGAAVRAVYRGFNGIDHLFTTDAGEVARGGYRGEGAPFSVWASPPAGVAARAVYRCLAGRTHFLSSDAGCEGQRGEGLLGYLRAQGGQELVRCFRGTDHLLTSRAECAAAGYPVEGALGYAL